MTEELSEELKLIADLYDDAITEPCWCRISDNCPYCTKFTTARNRLLKAADAIAALVEERDSWRAKAVTAVDLDTDAALRRAEAAEAERDKLRASLNEAGEIVQDALDENYTLIGKTVDEAHWSQDAQRWLRDQGILKLDQ